MISMPLPECRPGCGACCIAPSISSAIPGMPGGKPAGIRCVQLTADNRCRLFGRTERPAVCSSLRPSLEMCGASDVEAMARLVELERATRPPARRLCPAKPLSKTEASAKAAEEGEHVRE